MVVEPPAAGQVHLWWTSCAAAAERMPQLLRLLDEDERRRADRIRVASSRCRFVAARAAARLLVGDYTGTPPSEVRFSSGARGKPALARPVPDRPLHLNLGHSGDTAVAAFAGAPLGVDVEALRAVPNLDRLARRFFSEREQRWLAALPECERAAGFLTVWTCKEAYLKALGSGIVVALREIVVDPDRLRLARTPAGDCDRWTLLHTRLPEPALCTVVATGSGWRLEVRELGWSAGLESSPAPGLRG